MKKRLATHLATMVISSIATPIMAMDVHYGAKPEQSKWQMITNTPLECRMVHPIPNYGDAVFTSHASKKINLDFELKMKRPMGKTRDVYLVSQPPAWRPGDKGERITNIQFFQQFDGYVGGQTAWSLLTELKKGVIPLSAIKNGRVEISVLRSPCHRCYFKTHTMCLAIALLIYCLTVLRI